MTLLQYIKNPKNQTTLYERAFGNSGEEELAFNRKEAPVAPVSGRADICCDRLGVTGGRQDKRHSKRVRFREKREL